MKYRYRVPLLSILCLLVGQMVYGQAAPISMAFTVSLEQPATHIYHVTFRCDGLKGELQDFEMPEWMPGYYGIMNYPDFVSNFQVANGAGHALPWEKVSKYTWRVAAGSAPSIVATYDVTATRSFAASNYLGEDRAFIAPGGVFMYVAGHVNHPVTISIKLPAGWKQIASGLDVVSGKTNTFSAPDFDLLYDCPILMGNQEMYHFDVRGIPHSVAVENVPASVDRPKMVADLKTMVEAADGLMGTIPYKHYTFLMMGRGGGGIEHSTSSANAFNGNSLTTENGYRGWLSFIAHEYFHTFNVKRIRPIALGPFDYETENLTDMLWVSEGLTVYYQDIVLVRAGLETPDQYLTKMTRSIESFENAPGHHYQSAADSSMNTWNSGSGIREDRNTSISYYNNGSMIGAMLDLKIREDTKNQKSLDDVMRGLYHKYYLEKKRGFTDAEFRAECESVAGGSLDEVFDYAYTTKDVDYAKYFAYAGLKVSYTSQDAPGSYLGLDTETRDGKLFVVNTAAGSPAQSAGLTAKDEILQVDGTRATAKALSDDLISKKPGDKIKLQISRNGASQDLEIELGQNTKRTYSIDPVPTPTPLDATILKDWLRVAKGTP